MVHIELSSRGRDTIALEMPDISNECTLKAGFKEALRTTVFNYLFDYRMNIAIHYLLDTNKSIGEVAGLVGYEHQAHFCTAFRRKFNVTPSEYRLKA